MEQKLFVFDFDGTLVDTIKIIKIGLIEYSKSNNMKIPNIEIISHNYAEPSKHNFEWGIPIEEQEYYMDKAFSEISDKISNGIYKPTLFNNVKKLLTEIYKKGHKIAICTAREKHAVEFTLKENDLLKFVSTMKTEEDVKLRNKRPKPYPDLLDEIIEEMKIEKQNIYMIGDTDSDIKIAKNCSVKSIAVSYGGYQSIERLIDNNPDYIFDDIYNIAKFI